VADEVTVATWVLGMDSVEVAVAVGSRMGIWVAVCGVLVVGGAVPSSGVWVTAGEPASGIGCLMASGKYNTFSPFSTASAEWVMLKEREISNAMLAAVSTAHRKRLKPELTGRFDPKKLIFHPCRHIIANNNLCFKRDLETDSGVSPHSKSDRGARAWKISYSPEPVEL
jgi:hypothetical protein